ncbi:flagellin [uncultured Maricaulis sp.]|uniref:flagellin n=1 Tax=uncultured Maricaulis sp. TaxID=174710 RepID=UPI0025FB00C8|nr:flagellin [uncultured Maricaulis sp.]
MTRVSTFAANQNALMDLMKAQKSLFDAQKQLTTGKLATDLKGVGHQAETLSATRAALQRAQSYEQAAVRTEARLETQDIAMGQMAEAITDLRLAVTSKDGDYTMHQVREAFYKVSNALNMQHAGTYIFGGTRTDIAPVETNDIDDLIPMGTASEAFVNNDRRPQVQLDQNLTIDTGMLASDVGGEVFDSFKRIADFNAGANGPFDRPLSAPQETFLNGEIENVITALDNLNTKIGENGAAQANVETMKNSQSDRQTFLQQMLSDLEDVDMAEAATRFQQAQTALDVSAKTFSSLSQVSLLQYLR